MSTHNPPADPAFPAVHVPAPPTVYVRDDPAWEYRQLVRNLSREDAPSADELNQLGAEGWELAGLFTDSPFLYLYFKRRRD